jgi:ABC-type lipoprotein release transport system permease subunit
LTTLDGARLLADPSLFEGQPGQAFIGVIRIKVSGVDSPSAVSEARLARVASDIHEATGLHVDVVKGASPRVVQIDLPAGKDGRPAVTVTEGWSTIGVVLTFSRAVTAQNLALFTLVLVGSAGLVGQTAYMSVRRRRRELGVLRAIGWPAWRLATLIELETLVLGLLAGAISVVLGLAAAAVFHLKIELAQWLTALPVAVAIAALSAGGPAFFAAASGTTMTIMANKGSARSSHVTRSLILVGVRDLLSAWRAETALGIATVTLGASLMAILLLIEASFRGQLDSTVLGTYLAARVEPFHAVLAVLTLIVATFATAEILTLAYLERQPHLAVLRAIGWPRPYVLRLLAGQAFSLALGGGIVTAILVGALGIVLHASLGSIVIACGAGLMVCCVVGAAAMIVPLWLGYRLSPRDAMRAE